VLGHHAVEQAIQLQLHGELGSRVPRVRQRLAQRGATWVEGRVRIAHHVLHRGVHPSPFRSRNTLRRGEKHLLTVPTRVAQVVEDVAEVRAVARGLTRRSPFNVTSSAN